MGNLVLACIGSDATIGFEYFIKSVNNIKFISAFAQGQRHVIERTIHVVRRSQWFARHPEHTVHGDPHADANRHTGCRA